MGYVAFFIKQGLVVRKSLTLFEPQPGERMIVMDEEDAKATKVTALIDAGIDYPTLFDNPENFPVYAINKEFLQKTYEAPVVLRQDKHIGILLQGILEELGKGLPTERQEALTLLKRRFTEMSTVEEYWAHIVYADGSVTVSDGDGITAEVVTDGEIKLTFEAPFNGPTSFGVFVTFETDGVRYYTTASADGTECTIYLKALTDGSTVTEVTFAVMAKGRLMEVVSEEE